MNGAQDPLESTEMCFSMKKKHETQTHYVSAISKWILIVLLVINPIFLISTHFSFTLSSSTSSLHSYYKECFLEYKLSVPHFVFHFIFHQSQLVMCIYIYIFFFFSILNFGYYIKKGNANRYP